MRDFGEQKRKQRKAKIEMNGERGEKKRDIRRK